MMIKPDVLKSLDSGQCFRFKETNGVYKGVIGDKVYTLSSENINEIKSDKVLYNFFDLDRDYNKIKEYLSSIHPVLKKCIETEGGIRILKQDKEETLFSFILSSCNNITRIKGIIQRLCSTFSDGIKFPSASVLSLTTVDKLNSLGLGFRSEYILDAARKIDSGKIDLTRVDKMDNDEGRCYFKNINGIGDKVADCILLFAYNRVDVFPKDVHIKRIMSEYFNNESEKIFSPYQGIAQQFLFYSSIKNII